jgi:uncharacterized protein YuzE
MKLTYDSKADALYLTLADTPSAKSDEIRPGVIIDYDDQGRVIGVEVLHVQKQFPDADLTRMQLDLAS